MIIYLFIISNLVLLVGALIVKTGLILLGFILSILFAIRNILKEQ